MATREDVARATDEAAAAYRADALARAAKRLRPEVFDTWGAAVDRALIRGSQTGWKYSVRRVPNTDAYMIRRTEQRVRHRCNPARERELGRHAT